MVKSVIFEKPVKTATSTQLLDAANIVNTSGKSLGRRVWDTTLNQMVYASGTTATSPWADALAGNIHTPTV